MALEALPPGFLSFLRVGFRVLLQWWSERVPTINESLHMIDRDSQRSQNMIVPPTHTYTILPPSTQPVLLISQPSEATIQLLEYAQQVSPEFILYLCTFGMLCAMIFASGLLFLFSRRVLRWMFRSCLSRRDAVTPTAYPPYAPTHQQLSDAARHLFHFVRSQNPALTGDHPGPDNDSPVIIQRRR